MSGQIDELEDVRFKTKKKVWSLQQCILNATIMGLQKV